MKTFLSNRFAPRRSLTMLVAALLLVVVPQAGMAQVAVRGARVYTMAGAVIENGVVVIENGKISRVGSADRTSIPRGMRVIEAAVVTPGLIDAHSVVGMAGQYNYDHDQDQLDKSESMQPELRAIDAFNIHERLVTWVRELGVTTVHTGHGPGAVISGQTMVVKTWGTTVDAAVVVPEAMVAASLGESPLSDESSKSPGTRSKAIAMLRNELVRAQEYQRGHAAKDASKRPKRDLRLEVMVQVLDKQKPLLVSVYRHQDIVAALRVAEEFDIRMVLDGVSDAPLVIDAIKASGVPVILHPTMMRAGWFGVSERENASMETASMLQRHGIRFALQSGYESYVPKTRVVLFEAAMAATYGLSFEAALATITVDAAAILGVDKRLGSLEKGKDGDVALFDGNPFEHTSHCVGVIIDGQVVSEAVR
jgi:imidazolonepropionase-like amidohydrolase